MLVLHVLKVAGFQCEDPFSDKSGLVFKVGDDVLVFRSQKPRCWVKGKQQCESRFQLFNWARCVQARSSRPKPLAVSCWLSTSWSTRTAANRFRLAPQSLQRSVETHNAASVAVLTRWRCVQLLRSQTNSWFRVGSGHVRPWRDPSTAAAAVAGGETAKNGCLYLWFRAFLQLRGPDVMVNLLRQPTPGGPGSGGQGGDGEEQGAGGRRKSVSDFMFDDELPAASVSS